MALKTNAEMAELLQNAIVAVSLGKEVDVNGQRVRREDLAELRATYAFFKAEADRETNSNPQQLVTINAKHI